MPKDALPLTTRQRGLRRPAAEAEARRLGDVAAKNPNFAKER
eukprot:gene16467-21431_t